MDSYRERIQELSVDGTRRTAHLTMRVSEVAAQLDLGPGRFARGSYRVTVRYDGATYRLRPTNGYTSRLTRDGVRLGDLVRKPDGTVDAVWFEKNRHRVTPTDAVVGYTLAAAFGTGARFFLIMVLQPVFGFTRELLP